MARRKLRFIVGIVPLFSGFGETKTGRSSEPDDSLSIPKCTALSTHLAAEESLNYLLSSMNTAQFVRQSITTIAYLVVGVLAILILSRVGPVAIRLFLPIGLIALTVWLVWSAIRPQSTRLERHLSKRQFERAFLLAMKNEEGHVVSDYLGSSLGLPADRLRPRILAAFKELRALHASAYDPANTFVSETLKKAMQESSDEARTAFWGICRNLAVVADQGVKFPDDHHKIGHLAESIGELTKSASEVRLKLAELSLGATDSEIAEAAEAIENVRRQSEALLELEAMFGKV